MKTKVIIFISVILISSISLSQNIEKYSLDLRFGKSEYIGDWGNGAYNFDSPFYGVGSVDLRRDLSKFLDLKIGGSLGNFGYNDPTIKGDGFHTRLIEGHVAFSYKLYNDQFILKSSSFKPYLFAGVGFSNYNHVDENFPRSEVGTTFTIPLGGGFYIPISENASLNWQTTFGHTFADNFDLFINGKFNDHWFNNQVGLTFKLGQGNLKDKDGDGVINKVDKCPDIPGTKLNFGCPVDMDSDDDGLIDSKDDCPNQWGSIANHGCPKIRDRDEDGVPDIEDDCPTEVGNRANRGCPTQVLDSDGDGILDKVDKCPNLKGSLYNAGCPEENKVEIKTAPEPVKITPPKTAIIQRPKIEYLTKDSDNDGVIDRDDDCPLNAGSRANKGCPVIRTYYPAASTEVSKNAIFNEAIDAIQFNSGTAQLKTSSYSVLSKVVDELLFNPSMNILIEGHTDNLGDDFQNQKLSEQRAQSVKTYLISKGISSSRVTTVGYGEAQPRDTNSTTNGRYRNRRVEIKAVN